MASAAVQLYTGVCTASTVQLYTGVVSGNQTSAETPGERQHSDHWLVTSWQEVQIKGAIFMFETLDQGNLWRQNVFILPEKLNSSSWVGIF